MDPAPAPTLSQPQNIQPSSDLDMGDDFGSLREAIQAAAQDKPIPEPKPEKQVKAPKEAPVKTQKEEPTDKPKPTSLKDKLKVEDEPVEEKATEAEAYEDDIPTYKDRVPTEKEKATWKGLKQAKAEYDKILPEYEKLKSEFEDFKKKPVFDEKVTKELEELRRFRDMQDFKQSDTYIKEVAEPLGQIESEVMEISDAFKIDKNSLAEAVAERSEWKRNLAIEKVLKEADEDVPNGIVKTILDKASKLHDIWRKEVELAENAEKNRAAYEYERKQTVTKQTLEEQKAWQGALEESTKMIETQMGPLLKGLPEAQKNELMTALKEAKIADSPEERALQAQAPHLAAVLIEKLNGLNKEIATLRKTNKALSATTPTTNGRQTEAKKLDDDDDDGESLLQGIRQYSGRGF